jgi:hypothetical protein
MRLGLADMNYSLPPAGAGDLIGYAIEQLEAKNWSQLAPSAKPPQTQGSLLAWLQEHQNAVFIGAGALLLLAVLGRRR